MYLLSAQLTVPIHRRGSDENFAEGDQVFGETLRSSFFALAVGAAVVIAAPVAPAQTNELVKTSGIGSKPASCDRVKCGQLERPGRVSV
ncbi:hypothetical protein [Engelhardtia mirabilis]|uniref:hypothetical protein n=1 Tax=Engelhardtia mirabilis TaxID=2528011 RepID=UPI0011A9FB56